MSETLDKLKPKNTTEKVYKKYEHEGTALYILVRKPVGGGKRGWFVFIQTGDTPRRMLHHAERKFLAELYLEALYEGFQRGFKEGRAHV